MRSNQKTFSCLFAFGALCLVAIAGAVPEDEIRVAEVMLLYQRDSGGWPKNYDPDAALSEEDKAELLARKGRTDSTFDNGATVREVRVLSMLYARTGDKRYKDAALRGIEFMLRAQYRNGGWPQCYPRLRGYSAHITFNDGAMIGVMNVLRDVARGNKPFEFADADLRARAAEAVRKGIACILKCQIIVNDRRTAWCAQHDEKTFAPAKARSYELPSISGSESVGVVRFLMQIEKPDCRTIEAIEGAVTWFKEARIEGIRVIRKDAPGTEKGYDKVVVEDSTAPPMWARFNEIGTNKPIFCSRDGIPRGKLSDISYERRNGYSWLGYYASDLLSKDYPDWKKRIARNRRPCASN